MSPKRQRSVIRAIYRALLIASAIGPGICLAETAIPNTIAGNQLSGFMTALNSGDKAVLGRFLSAHFDLPAGGTATLGQMTDDDYRLYTASRGYEVEKLVESSPAAITVLARARATGMWSKVQLFVTAAPPDYRTPVEPYTIAGLGFTDIAAPADALPRKNLGDRQLRGRMRTLITKLSAADAFSGTIYVARHGKPVFAEARGMADRSWNRPNRIDTRYNLASVTKMFTAVAIAQLVEQGKLSYDNRVGDILPDYPNTDVAKSVTVAELLSHTSGLIGGRALAEKTPEPQDARSLAPWLATFVNEPLTARPGQRFDYSNAGYILLGAIIEKVSGQTYYDYVRGHIFKPAGMKDTDFCELDRDPANLARGYMDGPDGVRLNNIYALTVKGASHAGAYSTGPDMVRFSEALLNHTLLSAASLKRIWHGVTEDPVTHREYGFGASIDSYNGHMIVSHGGGWKGITNQFDIYPDLGYTVVVLSNIDDDPTAIAYKLREWLTQGPANVPPAVEPSPSFDVKTSVDGAETAGAPLTIGVRVTNRGGTSHAGIVDMEILDAKGNKANQQVTEGQKLETGETRLYTYVWTPPAVGRYTVQVGLFGPGWTPKYRFDTSAVIDVR